VPVSAVVPRSTLMTERHAPTGGTPRPMPLRHRVTVERVDPCPVGIT
jgi:hypothetical protein